jgi:hypothetical protein
MTCHIQQFRGFRSCRHLSEAAIGILAGEEARAAAGTLFHEEAQKQAIDHLFEAIVESSFGARPWQHAAMGCDGDARR